jgi:hypothetical protein
MNRGCYWLGNERSLLEREIVGVIVEYKQEGENLQSSKHCNALLIDEK